MMVPMIVRTSVKKFVFEAQRLEFLNDFRPSKSLHFLLENFLLEFWGVDVYESVPFCRLFTLLGRGRSAR